MATDLPYVARVSVEGDYDAENFVNVMHFAKKDGLPFDQTDLLNLFTKLTGTAASNLSLASLYESMATGLTIRRLYAKTLSNTLPIEREATTTIVGTTVGTNAPPMLASLIRWYTSIASRSFRGRTYLTGVRTSMINAANADLFSDAHVALLASDAADWVTAWLADATFNFIILSNKLRAQDQPTPWDTVESSAVESLICVQRRRRAAPA